MFGSFDFQEFLSAFIVLFCCDRYYRFYTYYIEFEAERKKCEC